MLTVLLLIIAAVSCRLAYLSGVRKGHLEMEDQNSRTWNAGFTDAKDFYAPGKADEDASKRIETRPDTPAARKEDADAERELAQEIAEDAERDDSRTK